jgi:dual specificity tyrosine-phosphorylation-regulated kinase 2/3/4
LKPENILFKTSDHKEVVVIDLGSATFNDRKIYNYIQSRYYRAPEVVLGLEYSSAIDIWSFGCILVELLNGYPLFVAENEVELIQCMMELLGPPPARLVNKAAHKNLFFDIDGKPKVIPNSKGKKRNPGSRRLRDVIRGADLNLIALLKACLEWDQLQRITAVEALNHPWFTGRQEPIIKHVKSQSTFSATRHLSLSKPKRK